MILHKMLRYEGSERLNVARLLSALRTSLGNEYIEHVRYVDSSKQVCDALERFFAYKNTMRLQYLKNEFARKT